MLSFIFFLTWVFSRNTSRKQAFSFMLVLLNTKLSVIKPMQLSKACIEYEVELFPAGCLLVVQYDSCRHLTINIMVSLVVLSLWKGNLTQAATSFPFQSLLFFFLHKQKEEKWTLYYEGNLKPISRGFRMIYRSKDILHEKAPSVTISLRVILKNYLVALISRNANVANIENHIART